MEKALWILDVIVSVAVFLCGTIAVWSLVRTIKKKPARKQMISYAVIAGIISLLDITMSILYIIRGQDCKWKFALAIMWGFTTVWVVHLAKTAEYKK